MRLLEALENCLELYRRGEIHLASPEVRETVYIGCAGHNSDLIYHLFSGYVRKYMSNMLNEEGMAKYHEGNMRQIKEQIERVRGKDLTGRRGAALTELILILLDNSILVDEDDKEILDKLAPLKNYILEHSNYPKEFPDNKVVLEGLRKLDNEAHTLLMTGILFIKGKMDRECLTNLP